MEKAGATKENIVLKWQSEIKWRNGGGEDSSVFSRWGYHRDGSCSQAVDSALLCGTELQTWIYSLIPIPQWADKQQYSLHCAVWTTKSLNAKKHT